MHSPIDKKRPDTQALLFEPSISINGLITGETLTYFLDRLAKVRADRTDLYVEINTDGGDADVARRIALEIRLFDRHSGRTAFCIGKTKIYSAGVTIFAAFPKARRFLADDAVLLVHERRMDTEVILKGPLKSCIQIISEQLQLLKAAEKVEREGFRELVVGSSIDADELYARATNNCYIAAEDALRDD